MKRPVRDAGGFIYDKGHAKRAEGCYVECLKLVRAGHASVAMVAPTTPHRDDDTLPTTGFSGGAYHLADPEKFPLQGPRPLADGQPTSLEGVKRRFKERLLKDAQKLAAISVERPPEGKSWFDVVAEAKWAKIQEFRDKNEAAEVTAREELIAELQKEAEAAEAQAKTLLAQAEEKKRQAQRATELVSYDAAARELKIARDTLYVFESAKDPRTEAARERVTKVEERFAQADLERKRYEWKLRSQAAFDEITKLGSKGSEFPAERLERARALSRDVNPMLAADDFDSVQARLAEIADWLTPPQQSNAGAGIAGVVL